MKKFNEFNTSKGILLNLFICDYHNPNWENYVTKLNELINILPNKVEPSTGHYKGLALQTILDTDLNQATKIANLILEDFKEALIVLSQIEFNYKNIPIGQYQDYSLVEPGRYFDKLIQQNKKGVFIHKN